MAKKQPTKKAAAKKAVVKFDPKIPATYHLPHAFSIKWSLQELKDLKNEISDLDKAALVGYLQAGYYLFRINGKNVRVKESNVQFT